MPPLDGDNAELPPKGPPPLYSPKRLPLGGDGVYLTVAASVLGPNGLALPLDSTVPKGLLFTGLTVPNKPPASLELNKLSPFPAKGVLLEAIKPPPKRLPVEGDSPKLVPNGLPSRSEVHSLNGVSLAGVLTGIPANGPLDTDMLPLRLGRSSQS